ncbi:hypothetical protein [Streptomyces indicus]|uniref:Uncharacterized protein n=1 Tax=Streptomyces indicus TaxID=417292 RepID=A0A1G8ZR19_9ACTN|nr:hypothetical protein [Streptomyces indicus]SDK17497.1 hypothetical protein SAMN05421806_105141 [Streptomyces indicus]
MAGLLAYALLSAGFAAVLGLCALLARHVRRRGTGGAGVAAAMAAYDEAFRVTAYEAHQGITAQAEGARRRSCARTTWAIGRHPRIALAPSRPPRTAPHAAA